MGELQLIPESLSLLQLLFIIFSPLLPFLCFELVSKIIIRKEDDDDDDLDGGINIFAFHE